MDSKLFSLAVAAILIAVFCSKATAQSSCTSALINLSPCLNYITGNETTPSSSCCSQLSNVVRSEPQCLCMVLNGGASQLGITINQTQAMALPGACKIQTPPASKCNSNGGGPSSSPTTPSSGSPSTPDVPSDGSGSKTTPAGGVDSSSSSVHEPFSMFTIALFMGAYLSMPSIGF